MKTLDELIKAEEICSQIDAECSKCPYGATAKGWCEEKDLDALHYLKVLKDILDPLKVKKISHEITCPQCNSAIAILLPESNEPLTWDELREMEGKPVWVEWTKTEESYWCFVGEWFDDDEMRIYHIGRDYADYIHKTIYTPDIVQAFRKERE